MAECLRIGVALTTALQHLHKHSLVHRDIKPSNIVFVGGQPKLADIGLVTGIEQAKSFVGTQGYVPPEGPGTAQGDLYSLGKVLYEIATGKDRQEFPELPEEFRGTAEGEAFADFNEILLRACAGEPARRFASAEQMRAELLLLQSGRSIRGLRANEKLLRRSKLSGVVGTACLASDSLEIGSWQDADPFVGHIGLVALWEGNISDANRAALFTNKKTSEIWTSAHGTPLFLAELNVAAGSVVDLASNASGAGHTGTTLDSGETLASWNFDGTGAVWEPEQNSLASHSYRSSRHPVEIMAVPAWVSTTGHGDTNPTTACTITLGTTAADDILIVQVINGGANAAPTGCRQSHC